MALTPDQSAPVREVLDGHCYIVGRRGRGEPRSIRDICPDHRHYVDIVCTLTGNKPEELFTDKCTDDRMDLMALADAIKNLGEQSREIPDDGSGYPDLVTTRRSICVLINSSRRLAKHIKEREQAMAATAGETTQVEEEDTQDDQSEAGLSDKENVPPTPATRGVTPRPTTNAPTEEQRNDGPGRERAALADITIAKADATATGKIIEGDHLVNEKAERSTSKATEKTHLANPKIIVTTPNESTFTAHEKEDLISTGILVGNEAAGPVKAPKATAKFVGRVKAKVTAAVAKAKRVRDMMC